MDLAGCAYILRRYRCKGRTNARLLGVRVTSTTWPPFQPAYRFAARIYAQNSVDTLANLVILSMGERDLTFNKRRTMEAVTDNPCLHLQFYDGIGIPLTDKWYLGRGVQLSFAAFPFAAADRAGVGRRELCIIC